MNTALNRAASERIVPNEVTRSLPLRVGLRQTVSHLSVYKKISAMNYMTNASAAMLCTAILCLCTFDVCAADPSTFKSELFKTGTLVYSDNFDGEISRERWGAPTKDKQIADGKLIVSAKFNSKEEAMKALKRDHHLGLEPVVHLNRIPEQFVCNMRYKFDKTELSPGRPSFQIGHHMIVLGYLDGGGHRIKLPDGPSFGEPDSKVKLGEWVNLIIEYKPGTIRISVNGYSKTYEHEKVTIINEKDKNGPRFSIKGGPECRIVFDSVRLWKCD